MEWLRKLMGKAEPAPTVTATLRKEPGNLYVLNISGVLNKATVDNIQAVTARDIDGGADDLNILVVLQNFGGWKRGDNWGDIDFFAKYEQRIAKIAVVGDMRWETETQMFLAAGHRRGEVRYFAPGQEDAARAWLKS